MKFRLLLLPPDPLADTGLISLLVVLPVISSVYLVLSFQILILPATVYRGN